MLACWLTLAVNYLSGGHYSSRAAQPSSGRHSAPRATPRPKIICGVMNVRLDNVVFNAVNAKERERSATIELQQYLPKRDHFPSRGLLPEESDQWLEEWDDARLLPTRWAPPSVDVFFILIICCNWYMRIHSNV